MEVVVAVVFDFDFAFFGGVVDGYVGGEVFLEAFGKIADMNVDFFGGRLAGFGFSGGVVEEGLGEFFGCADGELAADDLIGSEYLGVGILEGEDGLGMADGDAALGEVDLDFRMEIEEAHGVGDGGAGFPDTGGDFLLLEGEFAGEADVSGGFFDGIEILALEVLDESHFKDIAVGGDAFDDGNGGEAEFFRGSPAALAGDKLIFPIDEAGDEGLDDAVLADGLDEIIKGGLHEVGTGLERGGDDVIDGDIADTGGIVIGGTRIDAWKRLILFDEGSETFSEC